MRFVLVVAGFFMAPTAPDSLAQGRVRETLETMRENRAKKTRSCFSRVIPWRSNPNQTSYTENTENHRVLGGPSECSDDFTHKNILFSATDCTDNTDCTDESFGSVGFNRGLGCGRGFVLFVCVSFSKHIAGRLGDFSPPVGFMSSIMNRAFGPPNRLLLLSHRIAPDVCGVDVY